MSEEGRKAGGVAGAAFAAMSLYSLFLVHYICSKGLPVYLINTETDRIFWLVYLIGFAGLTLTLCLLNFIKTTKFIMKLRWLFLIVFLAGQVYLVIDLL